MKKLKIMTVVGTRPEIIRLSATIKLLDKYTNQVFVHTGQNYDYELNEIFFDDLGLRKPDYFMNVSRDSLGAAIGDIFKKTEEILIKEKPDALLVLGDTNSCLSAYMAKRMHIPIYHMEAGNRCFDLNVPEETNRRMIDHIADFNLVYTEHARRHLLSEGLPHRRIYLTGSPMYEVLQQNMEKIKNSTIIEQINVQITSHPSPITSKNYFVVSVHREENVDNEENLKQILTVLNQLTEKYQLPVIVSTHPRTRKRIESLDPSLITDYSSQITHNPSPITDHPILFLKPFGFTDYVHLQMNSICVISDSGTISEESAILNFPAVTIRNAMERPEAMDAGTIVLTGLKPDIVLDLVKIAIKEHISHLIHNPSRLTPDFSPITHHSLPNNYNVENTSWRVLKLILGTAKLSNKWWGIN